MGRAAQGVNMEKRGLSPKPWWPLHRMGKWETSEQRWLRRDSHERGAEAKTKSWEGRADGVSRQREKQEAKARCC